MPRTSDRADDADILRLVPLIRRVLANRILDPASVDDLVQETLVRVLEARQQLEQDALAPYAVATARNLAASLARAEQRSRRHAPRLLDPSVPERPDEAALRRQEAEAVKAALAGLSARDRDMLVAHEVEGVDTATLAHAQSTTPGSVAVRLARARATLRVDWLVAFRGVRLPTERCRPVLTALSAGDRRRQRALDAAGHLQTCPTCAELSGPLLERRRSLALLVPLVGLWWLLKRLWQWARAHLVAGGAGATAMAVVLAGALILAQTPRPATPPATTPPPAAPAPAARTPPPAPTVPGASVDGRPLAAGGSYAALVGKAVRLDRTSEDVVGP